MDQIYQKIGSPQPSTCFKIIRVFNLLAATLVVIFGIVGLVYMIINDVLSSRFFLVFSPIFIILFGFILAAVEFKVGLVMDNFDFLGNLLGRGIFYIYISSSVFYFFSCQQGNGTLAWVSSMIIFGLGITFMILHCCSNDYNRQVQQNLV